MAGRAEEDRPDGRRKQGPEGRTEGTEGTEGITEGGHVLHESKLKQDLPLVKTVELAVVLSPV